MVHFLLHWLGLDNASGRQYLAWSGVIPTLERLTELAVLGYFLWRHHNCHQKGCWRLGHKLPNSHLLACPKHNTKHPGRRRNLPSLEFKRMQRDAQK